MNELGIYTVLDLLNYFPYRYDDYELRDLEDVAHDERVTVEGKVHSEPSLAYYGKKRSRLTFRLLVGNYLITAVCFNRPYLKKACDRLDCYRNRKMGQAQTIRDGARAEKRAAPG